MARLAVKVTVVTNPVHPSQHGAAPVAAGAEVGDVYVSYDTTKIVGYEQLHSAMAAALNALANGNLTVNT